MASYLQVQTPATAEMWFACPVAWPSTDCLTSARKYRKTGPYFSESRPIMLIKTNFFLLFASGLALTLGSLRAAVIPISDSASLQQAINSAPDGSVIELAAGTYAAPSGGFTLYNPTNGFTVRAATGAQVTLVGN